MKKFTLLLTMLFAIGLTGLQAQSCAEKKAACSKGKTAAVESVKSCHGTSAAAAKLAAMDDTIEERVCPETGKVAYVRKETCPHSGNVSFASVDYDANLGAFVNVAPSDASGEKKACCDKDKATGCCSKGASAKNASEKKACDPAKCKGKVAAASTDKS